MRKRDRRYFCLCVCGFLGGFIYATLSHVKFCLTSGDRGIICSLSESIYIVQCVTKPLPSSNQGGETGESFVTLIVVFHAVAAADAGWCSSSSYTLIDAHKSTASL